MIDLSSIDVEDLLVRVGLEGRMTAGGQEVHFQCFGGEHSDGGAAYINASTTAWMCQGCKRKGNAITLVMEVQGVARATAERTLREWYGIEFDEPMGGSMVAEIDARFRPVEVEPDPVRAPMSWLSGVRVDWDDAGDPWAQYMLGRGFLPETLAAWDAGYDYFSDRVTIPVFDVDGDLVGIKGRDWTGARPPKYLILGDRPGAPPRYGFAPYEASGVVYGLHRNRDVRTVVLLEGELNAWALAQIGVPRPASTGMSYLSHRHAQLLAQEADEVVIYYDAGEAGRKGTWAAAALLEPHVRVRVVDATPEDPAELVCQDRGDVALHLIANAKSALALSFSLVSV